MKQTAQVVICGAGIAGVTAAYHLAKAGFKEILIVDPLPPLSLTSDRSTESYRNWWPDPAMVALMNRSIMRMEQLAEETGNRLRLNQRGYLYVTADDKALPDFRGRAERVAAFGAGPLRIHDTATSDYQPGIVKDHFGASGADLLLDPELIHHFFPYLTRETRAALHVRRAGWLSAQQLGMFFLEEARRMGAALKSASLVSVECHGGRVRSVRLSDRTEVPCEFFVNAAGPYLRTVGALLGVDIPVKTELHLKVSFTDHLKVVDRGAPLLIWADPQRLPWEQDEKEMLEQDSETIWLTEAFPAGAHLRPEGGGESQTVLLLWDYRSRWMEPVFPPPLDDLYPEVALRGLTTMLPGLRRYLERAPRPYMDGGYYVKTPENRLLASPLPVKGCYVLGGLSGYGIMSACASGELLALHMSGTALPPYAPAFSLERYDDPAYEQEMARLDASGEL